MNAIKSRKYLSMVQDESLAEHDKRFHPNGYDPKTMTCEFRERRAAIDPVDGDIDEDRGISGIYTGSSALYARPSLLHIGSGEGAQVYGFGLYGSNQRGVGEHYADIAVKAGNIRTTQNILHEKIDLNVNGHETNEKEFGEMCAAHGLAHAFIALSECGYDYEGAINRMRKEMRTNREGTPMHEEAKRGFKWLNDTYGKIKLTSGKSDKYLYEQTFFANRSKGDESHLINWYEKISNENISRIREQARKEGLNIKNFEDGLKPRINPRTGRSHGAYDKGEDVYMALVDDFDGSAKKASEFLARADIDGIKYPVDSYGGKTIKDGNTAGWNYVSFRDDNIRINRKFVNGEEVAVKDEAKGRLRKIAQEVMDELDREPVDGMAEHRKHCEAPQGECPFEKRADKTDAIVSANPNERTNRLAPNGKRSKLTEKQWHQVRSEEFKAWFGDWENDPENASKVVDENGEPMVVYHGTEPTARFRVFIPSMPGRNGKYYGTGSYFTESYGEAKNYGKGRVYECFLNIKKPSEGWNGKEPNSEEFGCDGAHIRLQGFWVATRPNQIKSAVNNSGRFSFDTDDIYDTIGKDGNPVIVKLKDIERKAKRRFQEPKPIYIKDLLLQKDEDCEYLD